MDISTNYITDFVCTYKQIDNMEESTLLYRMQLLQAFGLYTFDENSINKITTDLYENYKDNIYIEKLLAADVMKINNFLPDRITYFRLYFGYDTFHIFHSLLCSLINSDINTKMDTNNETNMENNLTKLINNLNLNL